LNYSTSQIINLTNNQPLLVIERLLQQPPGQTYAHFSPGFVRLGTKPLWRFGRLFINQSPQLVGEFLLGLFTMLTRFEGRLCVLCERLH
jgi:hypothetical protein